MTTGSPPSLVVFSVAGDLHGMCVAASMANTLGGELAVHLVDMDRRAADGGLSWSMGDSAADPGSLLIKDNQGSWFDLAASDVVWCRRFGGRQNGDVPTGLLKQQWSEAGLLMASTPGPTWVDHPSVLSTAEEKPRQLRAAQRVGFDTPRTLVSQRADDIREFVARSATGVIVKPLSGYVHQQLYTLDVDQDVVDAADSFQKFPAIFQERIDGRRHLRLVCVGDEVVTFEIQSDELDWRNRKDIEITHRDTDPEVGERCLGVLGELGLTMGVIDAKIDSEGRIWFFEVNPQGQFMFLEIFGRVALRDVYARHFLRALHLRGAVSPECVGAGAGPTG